MMMKIGKKMETRRNSPDVQIDAMVEVFSDVRHLIISCDDRFTLRMSLSSRCENFI